MFPVAGLHDRWKLIWRFVGLTHGHNIVRAGCLEFVAESHPNRKDEKITRLSETRVRSIFLRDNLYSGIHAAYSLLHYEILKSPNRIFGGISPPNSGRRIAWMFPCELHGQNSGSNDDDPHHVKYGELFAKKQSGNRNPEERIEKVKR